MAKAQSYLSPTETLRVSIFILVIESQIQTPNDSIIDSSPPNSRNSTLTRNIRKTKRHVKIHPHQSAFTYSVSTFRALRSLPSDANLHIKGAASDSATTFKCSVYICTMEGLTDLIHLNPKFRGLSGPMRVKKNTFNWRSPFSH